MKRKLLRLSSTMGALSFVVVFFGLAIINTPATTAVKATDFKAGRIIDDNVFYNTNTMTVAQIQSFMDSTLPACDMWGTGKIRPATNMHEGCARRLAIVATMNHLMTVLINIMRIRLRTNRISTQKV